MSSEPMKEVDAGDEEDQDRDSVTEGTATKKTAKTKPKKKAAKAQRLRVRQVRSGIRHPWRMRRTLIALGLKHHQDEVVVTDNPSIRGMLRSVHYLVSVTPEDSNG